MVKVCLTKLLAGEARTHEDRRVLCFYRSPLSSSHQAKQAPLLQDARSMQEQSHSHQRCHNRHIIFGRHVIARHGESSSFLQLEPLADLRSSTQAASLSFISKTDTIFSLNGIQGHRWLSLLSFC